MGILDGSLVGDLFHCRGCGMCWKDENHHQNPDARICPKCGRTATVTLVPSTRCAVTANKKEEGKYE